MPRANRKGAESFEGKKTTIACEMKIKAFGRIAPHEPVAQNGQCGTPIRWTLQNLLPAAQIPSHPQRKSALHNGENIAYANAATARKMSVLVNHRISKIIDQ